MSFDVFFHLIIFYKHTPDEWLGNVAGLAEAEIEFDTVAIFAGKDGAYRGDADAVERDVFKWRVAGVGSGSVVVVPHLLQDIINDGFGGDITLLMRRKCFICRMIYYHEGATGHRAEVTDYFGFAGDFIELQ